MNLIDEDKVFKKYSVLEFRSSREVRVFFFFFKYHGEGNAKNFGNEN